MENPRSGDLRCICPRFLYLFYFRPILRLSSSVLYQSTNFMHPLFPVSSQQLESDYAICKSRSLARERNKMTDDKQVVLLPNPNRLRNPRRPHGRSFNLLGLGSCGSVIGLKVWLPHPPRTISSSLPFPCIRLTFWCSERREDES